MILLDCKPFRGQIKLIPFILTMIFSAQSFANNEYWVGESFGNKPCKGKVGGYGPYDYTQRHRLKKELRLVEGAHFDENVESLSAGAKLESRNPLPDIDYTLRAFPNHHRALNTIITYQLRQDQVFNWEDTQPAECYLQRAIYFSPKDPMAHMLYGILLHRTNHYDKALQEYETALNLSPQNAQLQYNYALLLVDLERFDEARDLATTLYQRQFPLMGLKKQLIAAGHWKNSTQ